MPTYKMKCEECNNKWDLTIPIKDFDNDRPCPKCESKKTKQLIIPTPVHFKGGGWSK